MDYKDLFSSQEAREYLGLTDGGWNYLYSKARVIKPIPLGQRVYDGNDERHTTCVFSRRQLDLLKKRLDTAVDHYKDVEVVEPNESELGQVYSIPEAAEYLSKTPAALRTWLSRNKKTPHKRVGNQVVFLLPTLREIDDPYGLKEYAREQTA